MSLNESIVEDAALEWFRRRQGFRLHQGYCGQVGDQPSPRLRLARPHHHQSLTPATLRDPENLGLTSLIDRELSIAEPQA